VLDSASGLPAPVSRPSGQVRASVSAGVRFFGGSVFIGAARPLDRGAQWRGQLVFGQTL
jgi:hypothetical protein